MNPSGAGEAVKKPASRAPDQGQAHLAPTPAVQAPPVSQPAAAQTRARSAVSKALPAQVLPAQASPAKARASQPASGDVHDRDVLLRLYADFLARVDDESGQALHDALGRAFPSGSEQETLLQTMLSTHYLSLIQDAAEVETKIISTLFGHEDVDVDYLEPDMSPRIPSLHVHVLTDMNRTVDDTGCRHAFDAICATRWESFNVAFPLLCRNSALLVAGAIVVRPCRFASPVRAPDPRRTQLGSKDPKRQLRHLLEMVGTVRALTRLSLSL